MSQRPRANIIICGQTMSGKTTLLHKILNDCFSEQIVEPRNIVIFSQTAKIDFNYTTLIKRLIENEPNMPLKIYKKIDMDVLAKIKKR